MRVVVVEPPQPVVAWADADAHLNLGGDTTQQAMVEGMIAAATAHIDGPEGWLGRALGEQTLEARFGAFLCCGSSVRLPFPPQTALLGVKYLDAMNVEQTADLADFYLAGSDLYPSSGSWAWDGASLRAEAIRIRYTAGYTAIPKPIRAAILMMVADLYENRDTTVPSAHAVAVPMSTTVEALLSTYRVFA
ncbi:head-tail connector protein [Sphingomonas nostoxanthinifaciens]|uniref:head-tail connector protein n=1 Tax=Sphingomonas nostoxanthinifaciens TaxID=2872652 RepID=UPI001CC21AC3|nr:head-tail connector protein [Sphingomonas nostoxanthinifaciens]UAK25861.1 head-tail connector protein [Sphingomonas nostoxanthinifaciens]